MSGSTALSCLERSRNTLPELLCELLRKPLDVLAQIDALSSARPISAAWISIPFFSSSPVSRGPRAETIFSRQARSLVEPCYREHLAGLLLSSPVLEIEHLWLPKSKASVSASIFS
jgi:hypothetical protein